MEQADVVAMFATMHMWWAEDPQVPEFINRSDNAPKKATQASLPITDDWLEAMAKSALLTANYLPNDWPSWDGLVPSDQTWTSWQLKYVPLHSATDREMIFSSQFGNSSGSTHLAMVSHNISAASPIQPPTGL